MNIKRRIEELEKEFHKVYISDEYITDDDDISEDLGREQMNMLSNINEKIKELEEEHKLKRKNYERISKKNK